MNKCGECKRTFNSRRALSQHVRAKHGVIEGGRNYKKYLLYALVAAGVLGLGLIFYYSFLSPGLHDAFAKCLSSEGFIMAGTDWCGSCKKQKALFGKSFEYVNYVDCGADSTWCLSNNVGNYPTWILPGNTRLVGVQQLSTLSQLSLNCSL